MNKRFYCFLYVEVNEVPSSDVTKFRLPINGQMNRNLGLNNSSNLGQLANFQCLWSIWAQAKRGEGKTLISKNEVSHDTNAIPSQNPLTTNLVAAISEALDVPFNQLCELTLPNASNSTLFVSSLPKCTKRKISSFGFRSCRSCRATTLP